MGSFAVIFPAAGRSRRFGDASRKKIFHEVDGRAVWLRAVEPFVNREDVGQLILAIAPEDFELFDRRYKANAAFLGVTVVEGGAERFDTVAACLDRVDPGCDHVAVHDAARPFPAAGLIDLVFEAAREHGAALPGLAVSDTLKRAGPDGLVVETVPREGLYAVQTPQAFRLDLLRRAHENRPNLTAPVTDDAQLVEAIGHPCRIVAGSPYNIKITTKDDLRMAEAISRVLPRPRSGSGTAHPFADERAAWGEGPDS
ncbi:2-C-methyl-D-erythritol 4-phosphate cytidylyltransferase [Tautonia plasticadhaerens]|uniref:2-C-methyl-D-erythritol 4-phosphate cytidylyltransferase n=1 Tax=Tautonia plasticadhaerens TaxID=2527974 RepID=A0A518H112_9BACT|nr:2-C-methyl-D-erythritol 4-phosphate cytidylyltransferase [Tautonia plasticadhaerens]QDV34527.1 2-C-methyl-D-erythritol 4-phosphate cytidylyltransferase [Tautonia plasticadhaerens]